MNFLFIYTLAGVPVLRTDEKGRRPSPVKIYSRVSSALGSFRPVKLRLRCFKAIPAHRFRFLGGTPNKFHDYIMACKSHVGKATFQAFVLEHFHWANINRTTNFCEINNARSQLDSTIPSSAASWLWQLIKLETWQAQIHSIFSHSPLFAFTTLITTSNHQIVINYLGSPRCRGRCRDKSL